jgi:hypothetical protein
MESWRAQGAVHINGLVRIEQGLAIRVLSLTSAETLLHACSRDSRAHSLFRPYISSRLYCNPSALWKFNWFLRDFDYDVELLGREEAMKHS